MKKPRMGEPGWLPDHTAERREEYKRTTPEQRVLDGIRLSKLGTRVAVAGRRRKP